MIKNNLLKNQVINQNQVNKVDFLPLISIITAIFNGEKNLEKTIKNILNQDYPNLEYIIIDGGSTDGTLDIIKKYEDKIAYWVSEKDKGISDAFNKGIKVAKGDYINFQGDGDGFCEKNSVSKLFESVNPEQDMFVCGRIRRISPEGKELFISPYLKKFKKNSLLFRMSLPHQGLFTHKKMFEKYGLFDVKNTFCMDYEHLLRAYKDFPKVVTKDIVVANWRADGIGNNREREILREYNAIKIKNKVASPFVLKMLNFWTLFKYYVKKLIHLH